MIFRKNMLYLCRGLYCRVILNLMDIDNIWIMVGEQLFKFMGRVIINKCVAFA